MDSQDQLSVFVSAIAREAEGVRSFVLQSSDRTSALPSFGAGSHVEVSLPNGLRRSYSLLHAPDGSHGYQLAVGRSPESRGGSSYMHDVLKVGDSLMISRPRNNFPLVENADFTVLIAGGIGITPILTMAERLAAIGANWKLYYAARSRRYAALLNRLQSLPGSHVNTLFDDELGGAQLDFRRVVDQSPSGSHLYCCGPTGMLSAFQSATCGVLKSRVHVEVFNNMETANTSGGFTVELARSGRAIDVPLGKTILQTLLDAGIAVPYSCQEGLCGACETKVLGGVPEHRDQILSPKEKAENKSIFVCCSGSRTPRLVLDL